MQIARQPVAVDTVIMQRHAIIASPAISRPVLPHAFVSDIFTTYYL